MPFHFGWPVSIRLYLFICIHLEIEENVLNDLHSNWMSRCFNFVDDIFSIVFSERSLWFTHFLLLFVNFHRITDLQPSGHIHLTEGDPIEIPCTLDDTENYTIDDLELLYNRKSLPSEIIVNIHFLPTSGRSRTKFRSELSFTEYSLKLKWKDQAWTFDDCYRKWRVHWKWVTWCF